MSCPVALKQGAFVAISIFFLLFLPIIGLYSAKNHYLRVMKMKIELKRLFLFAVISVGVMLLADSLWVALATLVLLFVADYLLAIWENNRNKKADEHDDKSE